MQKVDRDPIIYRVLKKTGTPIALSLAQKVFPLQVARDTGDVPKTAALLEKKYGRKNAGTPRYRRTLAATYTHRAINTDWEAVELTRQVDNGRLALSRDTGKYVGQETRAYTATAKNKVDDDLAMAAALDPKASAAIWLPYLQTKRTLNHMKQEIVEEEKYRRSHSAKRG